MYRFFCKIEVKKRKEGTKISKYGHRKKDTKVSKRIIISFGFDSDRPIYITVFFFFIKLCAKLKKKFIKWKKKRSFWVKMRVIIILIDFGLFIRGF